MMTIRLSYLPLITACIPLACVATPSLDELYARQTVLKQAEQDYRQRAATLSDGESADFLTYIENLQRKLTQGCDALQSSGVVVPADINCPDQTMPVLAPAQPDATPALTESEQAAALEAELESGLGEFDELLLREQARVKADAPRTTAGGQANGGGQAGGATNAGTGGKAAEVSLEQPPVATGSVTGKQTVGSTSPDNIPDGSDDDVVARQLRRAAERETDPELKKKLWEEYRKYKQGTQSQ